jgi:hypothetical protein
VNELFRIGFGATLPAGAERVGIESDWLERFGRLLGQHGRCARLMLHSDARAPSDPQGVLERALVLDNATFRLLDVVPAWTRYVILDFRYSAVSDEKRDGVLRLGVNLATGALPDAVLEQMRIAGWLAADGPGSVLPAEAELPADWQRDRLLELVDRALRPRLDAALDPFVKVLRRRLGRDQERLYAYHNDLHREAARRQLQFAAGETGRQREEQRIEAIRREYQAKLDDLSRQYAMRVAVEWVQTLELVMAVQRFTVQIRRRKARGSFILIESAGTTAESPAHAQWPAERAAASSIAACRSTADSRQGASCVAFRPMEHRLACFRRYVKGGS